MSAIDAASRYLDALVSRDSTGVALADDVQRISNGKVAVEGADRLRAAIDREPPLTMGPKRWVADTDAAVFYRLEADIGDEPISVCVGERFVVENGRIHEIEVVYNPAGGDGAWPAGEVTGDADDVIDAATDAVIDAAQAYLASLVSHDASAVRATADLRRVENGKVTAEGAADLRASLESEIMHTVQTVAGERWLVAGDSAVVFYDLRAEGRDEAMMVRIAERFRVVGGELSEIEAVFALASE